MKYLTPNQLIFATQLENNLRRQLIDPETKGRYAYGLDDVTRVAESTTISLAAKQAILGEQIKKTAKELGIKPTLKAIAEYLNN